MGSCSFSRSAIKKQLGLALLLVAANGSALADWVPVIRSEVATYYVDQATIRRAGDRVQLWELVDYKKAKAGGNGKPYLSIKLQTEYACREEQYRILFFSSSSGNMGRGDVVSSKYFTSEWQPTLAGNVAEAMRKFGCAKR